MPDLLALFEPWLGDESSETELVSRVGIEAMLESRRNPLLRERMAKLLGDFRAVMAEIAETSGERGTVPADVSPAGSPPCSRPSATASSSTPDSIPTSTPPPPSTPCAQS